MENIKSTITLHAVGGAGINISAEILKNYDFDNLANLEVLSIDSTDKTVQDYADLKENFFRIESEKRTSRGIDGSGGERKSPELIKQYAAAVKRYMDEFELHKNNVNEFHVVIFSGSGGTGSTVGPLLIQELLQTNNVVLPIVIGDNSSLLFCNNTMKTLETLENLSSRNRVALPAIIYNNTIDGKTNRQTEKAINEKVGILSYLLGTTLSGKIRNIDNEDMRKFLQPTLFTSLYVKPGLYELSIKRHQLDAEDAFLVRTITADDVEEDVEINTAVLQAKTGYIIDSNIRELFDDLPINIFIRSESIYDIFEELEKEYDKLEQATKVKRRTLRSSRNSDEDETGLVI